jgi:hypothetical protein
MVNHFDELVLFMLRSEGKHAAVTTCEEETGVEHSDAVTIVETLERKHRDRECETHRARVTTMLAILLLATTLAYMVMAR